MLPSEISTVRTTRPSQRDILGRCGGFIIFRDSSWYSQAKLRKASPARHLHLVNVYVTVRSLVSEEPDRRQKMMECKLANSQGTGTRTKPERKAQKPGKHLAFPQSWSGDKIAKAPSHPGRELSPLRLPIACYRRRRIGIAACCRPLSLR
ncbi:hypothetical protein SISSUDRAFT_1048897 [Sistotremastrum suecicum HHB10207 ss-3]|uniref:Uncharacterized protein n=1 Tax=Sistotremastrum suecicum HHB10207 ss-3 TaxID=1314776 RepID=A0A166C6Y5_9AGAM|nr:hypothetical protein SISSUDRAFT_1048897 [Sistotremastrum suecicum HHB10207 ss-3]